MKTDQAIKILKHHQSMLSQIDGYTPEYVEGLLDPDSSDYAVLFSQALEIVLKGVTQDGKSKVAA